MTLDAQDLSVRSLPYGIPEDFVLGLVLCSLGMSCVTTPGLQQLPPGADGIHRFGEEVAEVLLKQAFNSRAMI